MKIGFHKPIMQTYGQKLDFRIKKIIKKISNTMHALYSSSCAH